MAKVVAVLGGAGFIGRYVVRKLAAEGHQVRVGGRNLDAVRSLIVSGDIGQIVPWKVVAQNESTIKSFVSGADVVINLAGILFERGKQRFDLLHHQLPKLLSKSAKESHVQTFVHLSALGANPKSDSVYARTKALGEEAVQKHFPEATIFRPSVVFGSEDKFLNTFATIACVSPFVPLIYGGKTKFQPVYVVNFAEALVRAVDDPTTHAGQLYELGGPGVYSFKELLSYLLHVIQRDRILLPLPDVLVKITAFFNQYWYAPVITPDQLRLLKIDNVLSGKNPGFAAFGIAPDPLEAIIPAYLDRFRPHGRYATARLQA